MNHQQKEQIHETENHLQARFILVVAMFWKPQQNAPKKGHERCKTLIQQTEKITPPEAKN